jgi:hypothetical protein
VAFTPVKNMSTLPERTEKRCLNCEILVYGRYCQVCGQENSDHHMTFLGMVRHFVFDIFHFDGKFFTTLKKLITRPGLVSKEYVEGKRARHLEPIKMYVFTSAIFFILFFMLFKPQIGGVRIAVDAPAGDTLTAKQKMAVNGFDISQYANVAQFDSLQNALPQADRFGWGNKMFIRRGIYLREKYGYNNDTMARGLSKDFTHKLPQALLIMLPIYAFLLWMLYSRRKKWVYSDHGIFSIHFFIIGFICFFLFLLAGKLREASGMGVFGWLEGIFLLTPSVYLYFAMRRFYGQGTGKTLLKWALLSVSSLVLLFAILILLAFYSFLYA